ncbi:MAG: Npt1/Npt2 family nucleotide transporter [bacterium]
MFKKIRIALWGNLTKKELLEFGMLAATLFIILGSYWLMKPLKDAVFMKTVGRLYLPYAKIASFLVIFPLILIYSKLVDLVEKQKLFYIICSCYSLIFLVISLLLTHNTIGLANTNPSPKRIIGWILYVAIETFGSLLVTLFWSFVVSSTDVSSAKRGYPLILAGAQIGAICGPSIAIHAPLFGIPTLTLAIAISVMLIPILIKIFITLYPATAEAHIPDEEKTGPLEGIKLLFSHKYLLGILGVATLFDIIASILEYQLDFLADITYHSAEKITSFIGYLGLTTNSLSLVFAVFGTGFLIRQLGLTFCLVLFPIVTALAVCNVLVFPTIWILFASVVIIKALSYALNNPSKEIMYIPTSRDVKFKTKSWIDMFGLRTTKAIGSGINMCFTQFTDLIMYGSLVSFGVIGIWIAAAFYVGKTNKKLIESGQIIK